MDGTMKLSQYLYYDVEYSLFYKNNLLTLTTKNMRVIFNKDFKIITRFEVDLDS